MTEQYPLPNLYMKKSITEVYEPQFFLLEREKKKSLSTYKIVFMYRFLVNTSLP